MRRWFLVLVACGGGTKKPDASVDAGPRCTATAPFGAPLPVAGLNTNLDEQGARLTPDELTVVFARTRTNGTSDLYLASRATTADAFGTPELLGTANSVNSELWPTLAPDALLMLFDSNRGTTTFHVYITKRTDAASPFGPPMAATALADGDGDPLLANATALYFASAARPGLGMGDIYRVDIDATGATGTPAAVIGDVNGSGDERAPAITADERIMAFARNSDVYLASRSSPADGFGTASPVDGLADATAHEAPTWISPDGCHLYIQSDAAGGQGGLDLYVASRPSS